MGFKGLIISRSQLIDNKLLHRKFSYHRMLQQARRMFPTAEVSGVGCRVSENKGQKL
jgi:hypothetical protein